MPGDTKDVRVRLSLEGEQQIQKALQTTLRNTQQTTARMQRSVEGVNKSLASARTLFGQLAAAASVSALVAFARASSEAADKVGKTAQSVGAAVRNFSALSVVARTANVPIEQLGQAMNLLNRRVTEARGGSEEARKAFKVLGVSIQSLRGKDAAEQFALVAQGFARLKDSPEKSALAFEIFGRTAGALIPLLNDLGEVGLVGAIQRAEELGLVMREDTARAAQALNDDLSILGAQVQALGAAFVEGLAPALHVALGGVQKDLGGVADVVREVGRAVGQFIGLAILTFQDLADQVGRIPILFGIIGRAAGAIVRGDIVSASAAIGRGLLEIEQFEKSLNARREERLQRAEAIGQATVLGASTLPRLRSGAQEIEAGIIQRPGRARKEKSAEASAAANAVLAFQAQQNAIDQQRAQIQAQVDAGVKSEVSGRQEIAEIQQQNLPVMRELAAAALVTAQALGDPQAIERARELGRAVELVAIQVESTGSVFARLGAVIQDTLVDALADLFTTGIRGAQDFIGAVTQVALSVVEALQQILAQELAVQAVRAFSRAFGLPFAKGGQVGAYAAGGRVSGAGTGISDSIPAMLSHGEFVVRAAVVERPGILEALQSLNAGASTRSAGVARGYAAGGLVSSGPAESRLTANLTLGLEDGLVLRQIQSPAGQRAVINVVAKNPRGTRSALGG